MNLIVSRYKVNPSNVLEVTHVKVKDFKGRAYRMFGDKKYKVRYFSNYIEIFFPRSKSLVEFTASSNCQFFREVEKESKNCEVWSHNAWFEGTQKHNDTFLDQPTTDILKEELQELLQELKKGVLINEFEIEVDLSILIEINGEYRNLDWSEVEVTPDLLRYIKSDPTHELNILVE